jgi:hypothetical protein
MNERTNLLFDDLEALTVSTGRLTVTEFSEQVREHTRVIRATTDTLRTMSSWFSSGRRVWPPVCNDAISCLTSSKEYIRGLQDLLERSIHLPLSVVPLRLSLLLCLKNVEAQITTLNYLLADLRDAGKTALSQPAGQRREIERELAELLQRNEEVVYQSEHLLDRARFKERTYSMPQSCSFVDERN